MSTIKKAFGPIMAILEANKDKKVSTIIDQVIELASAKQGGGGGVKSFHKDENDVVIAARCGYFGLWFLVADVEFGAKAGSASGLNTMCKAGVSAWTKGNAAYKKGRSDLLDAVADPANEEVTAENLTQLLQDLETAKDARPDAPGVGYATLEELLAAQ